MVQNDVNVSRKVVLRNRDTDCNPTTSNFIIPMPQNILGDSLPDDDEIDHDKTDAFKGWLRQPDTSDVLSQIKISGKRIEKNFREIPLNLKLILDEKQRINKILKGPLGNEAENKDRMNAWRFSHSII